MENISLCIRDSLCRVHMYFKGNSERELLSTYLSLGRAFFLILVYNCVPLQRLIPTAWNGDENTEDRYCTLGRSHLVTHWTLWCNAEA